MPFPHFKPNCLVLSIAIAFGAGEYRCPAQSEMGNSGSSGSLQLPKLCMPVSYRQGPTIVPLKTKIGMLGDRYREVSEALLGWNETGVPLVGKFNNRWEAVPCGDDTGLFYLVPLLARQTGWSADRSIDAFLLGMIVFSATGGVAGLWLTTSGVWPRLLAVVPIAGAAYLSYKMGDVYVVQGSVVLLSIPWLIYVLKADVRSWFRFLIVFLLGIGLGFAQWIRMQSGPPVLVFFAILLYFSTFRRSIKILLSATLLIGMSLPSLYEQFPLHEHDRFLVTHRPGYQPSLSHHLFWHTAYLGLSYLTNPYVSAWRDLVAVQYVQTVDPNAIYGGEKYEALLRSRVEEIIHRDHKFIFYTVAAKAGVLACMLLLCINIGLAAAISCPKSLGTELAFWLATTFAALPGIIAIPAPQYVLGMITLALLYWYYSISYYVERCSARPTKTGRAVWGSGGGSKSNQGAADWASMSGPYTTAMAHQPSLDRGRAFHALRFAFGASRHE
jgi:hypothetical protein